MKKIFEKWSVGNLADGTKANIHRTSGMGRIHAPTAPPKKKSTNQQFRAGQSHVIRSRTNLRF